MRNFANHAREIIMVKNTIIYILLSLVLFPLREYNAQQYDGTPCFFDYQKMTKSQIEDIRKYYDRNIAKITLSKSYSEIYPNVYQAWSSSILRPDGKPPIKKTKIKVSGYGTENIFNPKYVQWSCMYSAYSLADKNTNTAWSEGLEGDGIGEFVIAQVNIKDPIKIWAGFGKNAKLFNQNNRPKDIKISVLVSTCGSDVIDSEVRSNFHHIGDFSLVLKDINNFQPLVVPQSVIEKFLDSFDEEKFSYPEDCSIKNMNSFIKITILSVYKGSKFSDTLITEISN